jgi:Concanavalin A-like lectin/glucanases superfamily/Bacterial TSP3 repeat/Bacterial Ig-like domain
MKLSESASHLVKRVGLGVGLASLAGVLLAVSIAVSAEPPRSAAVGAGLAPALLGAPPLAAQAAQPAPGGPAQAGEAAAVTSARPSRFSKTSKVFAKGAADPAEAVRRAWQRARDAGVYAFATDLAQITYPARSLSNAGRGPDRSQLHMEGQIDQPARTLEFRMWQPSMTGAGGAASGMAPGSGAEARIEGDRAYVRPLRATVSGQSGDAAGADDGAGADWKEVEDFSASFAPDNDPLAFLGGMKNVQEIPGEEQGSRGAEETSLTFHVSRFTFDLDGPTFAMYMRDQLEQQLSERGELPLNLTLEAPDSFRKMTGSGELWVDAQGFPLRLAMHLAFPEERNGSHLEADVQTDFSGFPQQVASIPKLTDNPVAWANSLFSQSAINNPQSPINKAAETGGAGGALACGLGATALLLACRRSRRLYAAVVIAVIFSMVVVPLMQSERALAFFERQAARAGTGLSLGTNGQAVDAEIVQKEEAAQQAAANSLAPAWDPHRDPLAQPDTAAGGAVPVTLPDPGPVRDGVSGSTGATSSQQVTSEESLFGLPAATPAAPAATPTPTPTPDPCAKYSTDTDTDNDGVNDHEECKYSLDPGDPDKDDDGLNDGQELYKLGTDGGKPDTDGDLITDTLEVRGFVYPEGGEHWYLNPNNADTNNDSLIDSVECPALVDIAEPTADDIRAQCDSDKDGIPNLFESDNDNDGVPDRVDLSPDESMDRNGVRTGQATADTAFDSAHPFTLTVQSLQEDWPVLVDLQMRPVTPTRLSYAMNVLDWPVGDVDGQIQHGADSTFQDSTNDALDNPNDEAGGHGDMRLVPLLEIVMTGAQIPLKLTEPAATVTVGKDTPFESTVALKPAANNPAYTDFTFTHPEGASLELHLGTCASLGILLISPPFEGTSSTYPYRLTQLADGNHALVVKAEGGSECADILDIVNGPYDDRMVDLSVLSPYGITARDQIVAGEPSVVLYVPLSVATDDTGGGKSAFQSHMIYWVGGDSEWQDAQQMRIVWLVQMLTDTCAADAPQWKDFEPQYKVDHPKATDQEVLDAFNKKFADYCAANRTPDAILPVQTYDESWTLAGLSVREDHGLDVAVAYINPVLSVDDASQYDDDPLWTLSSGLGDQFVAQRDCERDDTIWNDIDPDPNDDDPDTCAPDNKRDLTVFLTAPTTDHTVNAIGNSTIKQRFDITTTVPITQRWGIEPIGGLFPLAVEDFRYADQDYLAYLSATETPRILAQFNHEVTPTLVVAREERYRAAGLEAGAATGGGLTVDLNKDVYQEETLTGLNWAPFRYNPQAQAWEAYPSIEYWDALGQELEDKFYERYPDDPPETALGWVTAARSYSFALINGVASTFRCSPADLLCAVSKGSSASDVNLIKAKFALGTGANTVVQKMVVDLIEAFQRTLAPGGDRPVGVKGWLYRLGKQFFNPIDGSAWGTPGYQWAAGIVIGAALVALITTIVVAVHMDIEKAQAIAVVLRGISLGIAVYCAIHTFARVWTQWAGAANHPTFRGLLKSKVGWNWNAATKAGIVFTCIAVVLTWGLFLTQFFVTDMKWGSMATDSAFAGAIATTIVTVMLFIIFTVLGPVGAIIQGIIGVLNAIASLICSALPQDMQSGKWGQALCGGITGFITWWYKRQIYSGTILAEMDPEDYIRLELGHFDTRLADEEAGVVVGNKMIYSIDLTNTIALVKTPIELWELWWGDQFNVDNLRLANFKYQWQTAKNDLHKGLALSGIDGGWDPVPGFWRRARKIMPVASDGTPLTEAGINRSVKNLYLSEGYALPEQECWGYMTLGKCQIVAERSTSHFDMGAGLKYDVLPATLDGFYELAHKPDGYALAWGQQGDLTFPTLFDADGDGLSRTDDPDDSQWDADGDGLSDAYELNTGSDPFTVDTDNDGLTDHQEAKFGADPASKDGDGDGLYDCQEVFHQVEVVGDENVRKVCGDVAGAWSGGWTIVYGMDGGTPLRTLVTSDPGEVDTDADGLSDRQEYVYGFNPNLPSNPSVLSLSSQLSEYNKNGVLVPTDGYIKPGQGLYYAAAVVNELDERQAEGLLWTEPSPAFNMSKLPPQSFDLGPHARATMGGPLQVLSPTSGAYKVTQVAGALIANLTLESDQAALWMRFDNSAAPLVDGSGSIPPHDGACYDANGPSPYPSVDCGLDPAGGRIGGGLKLSGATYVDVPLDVSETAYAVSLWFRTTCTTCGIFSVTKGTTGGDRHVYLSNGNVCAGIYSGEFIATWGTNYADGQWHHLVHTFGVDKKGQTQGQKLYLDGALEAGGTKTASDFTWQDGINIGFAHDALQPYFSGSIDDVRVFSKALTQAEVRELANLSVFHMNFDQTTTWADVSNFKTPVSGNGPSHDSTTAVHGSAVSFNGATYLSVPGGPTAPQLDMSGGRFTLSAWIYPRKTGDARDTYAQGILGLDSGLPSAYPTLQRVGKKIRFSLGTGTAWFSPYTSGDVLTENQWNHVAVTLDKDEGKLRLYVNGELQGDPQPFAVPAIAATRSFDIGRSSSSATLKINDYQQWELNGEACREANTSHVRMAIDQVEVFNQSLHCTESATINKSKTFNDTTTLTLLGDGDTCTMSYGSWSGTSLKITSNDSGFSDRTYNFTGCGTGSFTADFTNLWLPFYGYMDELQIFGQALDEDAVRQLYLDAATLLHLPLDEAPGATAFEDVSGTRVPGSCASSGCPVSGTTGRINRAAQFQPDPTKATGSAIRLGHSAANELASSFTVAAWIKPSSVTGIKNIVSTARQNIDNGWGFRLSGSNLAFEPYGYGTTSTSQLALPAGRWSHVAAVIDASYGVTFYVNGAPVAGAHTGTYGGAVDGEDNLLVGAAQPPTWFDPYDTFDGMIDDVWVFNRPLSADRIVELYESAPALHMLFDEPTGATQFADNAVYGRTGTCTKDATTDNCPLTGEGVQGQIGLAAQFDGVDDSIVVDSFGSFNETTVSAWVKRTGATTARETIVSYKEGAVCGFVLELNDDGANQYPRFYVLVQPASGTLAWQSVTSEHTIPLNTWVHLAGTYDGNKIRLYRNGVLQVESSGTDAAGTMVNTCTASMAIGSHNSLTAHWFPGAIDEVQVYGQALTPRQIGDLYDYQSAWVESRKPTDITVDGDSPTADLQIADRTYLADQTIWVGITAKDPASPVDLVELRADKGSIEGVWTPAERCTENIEQPDGAWCAQFTPTAGAPEGVYTLLARATDRVGYVGPNDSIQVYVDDTAPVLGDVSYGLVGLQKSAKGPQTWVVPLSGGVTDPPLAGGIPGSGVPADGVRVTILDGDGMPLGDPGQVATVSGGTWSLDYEIDEAEPDGCYTVEVEAVDAVARLPQLNADQVGRHTTSRSGPIVLEASAPQVLLDRAPAIAGGQLGSGVTSLAGETTHRPAPVEVDLTAAAGAEKTRVRLTCRHGNEGSWYTLFDLPAGTLAAGETKSWEGEIHQGSLCQAELTTTASAGGVSGVVKVCGDQVAEWSGDLAVSEPVEFAVHSDSCVVPGCPAGSPPPVTSVQGVDLAFRPVLPGSAFVNETPPTGEALHLPFEDIATGSGGMVVRDVSGAGADGSCAAGACPVMGQPSPSGTAGLLDGVDDAVTLPNFGAFTRVTASAWVKPTSTAAGQQTILSYKAAQGWCGFQLYLQCDGQQCIPYFAMLIDLVTLKRGWITLPIMTPVSLNTWAHVAATYDGASLRVYRDGQEVNYGIYPGNMVQCAPEGVAAAVGADELGQSAFAGQIDEVSLFDHALTASEVKDLLYTGSGPVLVLPFEKPLATGGDSVADSSGWGRDGVLSTGAADIANKAASGQVGNYALQLDGVDDYAVIPDDDAIDFDTNHDFAVAAWLKPDPAQAWTATVENNVIEKWSGAGGYPYVIRYLNQTAGARAGKIYAERWDGQHGPSLQSTARIDDGRFHHVAFVKSGSTLALYVDGVQQGQTTDTTSGATANTSPLYIGRRGGTALQAYFTGSVDDVRITPRALSALEVADLQHAGWQAATLAQNPAPGVTVERTSWSAAVPAGLEGTYQVEMRGRDAASHEGTVSDRSLLWRGEADNLAPRVTLTLNTATNQYTTVAEDYNLVETGFSTPCGATGVITREPFLSPWYLGTTGDRQKLYRLTAVCPKPAGTVTEQSTACDSFDNCRTCDRSGACTTSVGAAAVAPETGRGGGTETRRDADSLRVTASPGPGVDLKPGNPGFVISVPAVITTSHYYEPHTIDVAGTSIAKHNPLRDGRALAGVQVAIGDNAGPAFLSEPAAQRPYTVTWTFPWRLPGRAALPDGVSFTAAITATDLAGRTTRVNRTLIADVVPPVPVSLTLTSNGQPVEPGAIITETETPPDLALTWTPSSDGSGLAPYLAAWRIADAYTTTVQTSLHDAGGAREAHLTAGEAQRITTGVVSRDVYGNERRQAFGSVVVDGPLTPDYFTPLGSAGTEGEAWMESGCTLGGADRRIADLGSGGRMLPLTLQRRLAQHGYITWDHRALRLAWTGANWSDDGDLFVYLDTGPGGTNSTLSPYTVGSGGTTVILPAGLLADVLIWVHDPGAASLLRWNDSEWAVDRQLTAEQFRFDGALRGGQTDLYLPFELLGLSPGDPLGLLAFAAQEPAPETGLRIWATFPIANPVNSRWVNRRLGLAPGGSTLTLLHAARWAALSDGVCPNGTNGVPQEGQQSDARIRMTVESDPPGAAASGVAGGVFWVSDPGDALAAPGAQSLFGFLNPAHPPLPDGQRISYTIHYRNDGSATLEGAWLALSAYGALQVESDRIDLGEDVDGDGEREVQPGFEGTVTFQGTTAAKRSALGLAVALVGLHAAGSGPDAPLEWLVAAHRVDRGAPEQVGLHGSSALVGPRAGWLQGDSFDESGVSHVDVEITSPAGATFTLGCDPSDAATGGWSCPWDATAANGGSPPDNDDQFSVRLRATDRFGSTSEWSTPQTIRVDAQPPTVTVATGFGPQPLMVTQAAVAAGASSTPVVRGSMLRLMGDTADNNKVGTVTVCLQGQDCERADLSTPGAGSSGWSRWLTAEEALDYVTKTVTIRAADRLGNTTAQALELAVVFDNVAPVLTADPIRTQAPLSSTETVLSGAVGDGGPDVTVSVRMQAPNADVTRMAAARDGETWWFDLPADAPGQYTLWADAEDRAGNVTTAGPFTVTVTCTDAGPVVTSLAAEPVAGWPVSLTLTAVISNTGPDSLPAGIPVAFSRGATPIGSVTTTLPLASGASTVLSLVWAPDATGDHDIKVIVGQIGNLPYVSSGPLCVTPAAAHFTLPVRELPLYYKWNLISPQVNPSNTAAEVVQRGIDGPYAAILGYDGGLLAYYPGRPQESTLQTIDARHGYWVRTIVAPDPPPTDTLGEAVVTWRMAGEILPEDQPLALAAGWNLAAYLPYHPLTVTTALQGIAGQYASVLGFEYTALSYYPDLDPSYNTLGWLAPGYGYWISATKAITLRYPVTGITNTLPVTAMRTTRARLDPALQAELAAGVRPTYDWMNFYGVLSLPDGTGAPTGTVVLAVDPQGVICGATATWAPGQYGLLACYRDDPDTPADEGAVPGDTIRLVVGEGSPPQPTGRVVGEGTWTAHGARQQVPRELPPELPMKSYLPLLLREESPGNEAPAPGPEAPGTTPGSGSD